MPQLGKGKKKEQKFLHSLGRLEPVAYLTIQRRLWSELVLSVRSDAEYCL